MVGMRRPTKGKVEVAETTAEDDPGVDSDTGVTGEQVLPLEPAPRAHPMLSAAAETKLEAASDAFLEAEMKADALREIATECEQKEKLAQRLHDAKMRRLENGDINSNGGRLASEPRRGRTRQLFGCSMSSLHVLRPGARQRRQNGMQQGQRCS